MLLSYCQSFSELDTEHVLKVWNTLCRRGAIQFRPLDPAGGSILTNADLTFDPANQAFDWHLQPQDGVLIGSGSEPENGLRIELNGNQPEECVLLTQVLPLAPGATYEISWKSAALGSDKVTGLAWVVTSRSPQGEATVQRAIEANESPSSAELRFTAAANSGKLQLLYKRPLGSTRAHGTVLIRDLRSRLVP